jgi:hypothetical protein
VNPVGPPAPGDADRPADSPADSPADRHDPAGETAPDDLTFHLDPGGGLVVYRPLWRRPWRIVFAAFLVGLFLVPLMVDGLWWLTLLVSEVAVGAIVIIGSTAHRRAAAVAVGCLALLGAVGLEAYNDVAFGTLSLRGAPPLVFTCGTEYTRTTTTPVAVAGGAVLLRVGTTPSGMSLLVNRRCGGPASAWAFVALGPRTVLPYLADHYTGPSVPYWG